jgi:hypothetical protein
MSHRVAMGDRLLAIYPQTSSYDKSQHPFLVTAFLPSFSFRTPYLTLVYSLPNMSCEHEADDTFTSVRGRCASPKEDISSHPPIRGRCHKMRVRKERTGVNILGHVDVHSDVFVVRRCPASS